MAWPAAAAIVGAGAIGAIGNQRAQRDAANRMNQIIAMYENIRVPTVEEQKVILQEFENAGLLTPELQRAITQPDSVLQEFQEDPRLREAQLGALTQLQEIGSEGGLMLADRAALEMSRGQAARDDRGRREAILQGMERRGMSGSGQELAAMLSSNQEATNRQSQEGLQIAALAQQRALDAIMQGGQMGGQVRGQDFDIAQRRAAAQDQINQFNTSQQNVIGGANVDRVNRGREANLTNQQDIMNRNAALRNQEQMFNTGLIQQRYQNEMAKAAGVSGAQMNMANLAASQGAANAQMIGGIGSGLGQVLASSSLGKATKSDDDQMVGNSMGMKKP